MMVEITGNSGVSKRPTKKQKREAAALRCLSDVVDAGDRNFEIDIAEECTRCCSPDIWDCV